MTTFGAGDGFGEGAGDTVGAGSRLDGVRERSPDGMDTRFTEGRCDMLGVYTNGKSLAFI